VLRELATRYADLPYRRARSDAECLALERVHDGGFPPALLNSDIEGEEADLPWPQPKKRIIEIDGPQYHRFKDEDARKQRIWEAAGWTVRRISSDAVFDQPETFLELVRWATDARR
jgi:hypothetical protein